MILPPFELPWMDVACKTLEKAIHIRLSKTLDKFKGEPNTFENQARMVNSAMAVMNTATELLNPKVDIYDAHSLDASTDHLPRPITSRVMPGIFHDPLYDPP